jgi:hypothetical protein
MTTHQWLHFAGMHQRIHRVQMRHIVRALPAADAAPCGPAHETGRCL